MTALIRMYIIHADRPTDEVKRRLFQQSGFYPDRTYQISDQNNEPPTPSLCRSIMRQHLEKRHILIHNKDVPTNLGSLTLKEVHQLIRYSFGYKNIPKELFHSDHVELIDVGHVDGRLHDCREFYSSNVKSE